MSSSAPTPPTPAPPPVLDDAERAELQRRVLRVLTAGQIVGAAALAAAVTIGAFVVQEILGEDTSWGGIATAMVTVGTGVMAQVLSSRMRRLGRRAGLQLGYALAAAGGLVAALGAEVGSLPIFLVGLFLFGNGQASNLLARYAAADLAPPEARGRAISRIVFASTFGAVLGPLLIGPGQWVGEELLGLGRYTGPWIIGAVCFALAGVNTAARLRPDPLVVAGGVDPRAGRDGGPDLSSALRAIRGSSPARLALFAMIVSQAAMVAVMTMTPVHMKHHGHESLSPYVISLHIAGMYAFSPLVGRFNDRRGSVPTIAVGAVILGTSTVLAAVASQSEVWIFPALWGLGVGWNFGLIGGSSLLTSGVAVRDRVTVQGAADLMMSLCGGLAGFSSGFILASLGYPALANLATLAAAALVVAVAVSHLRRDRAPTATELAVEGATGGS
ncbi:MAG TPA: MFS transporter [Acidimicrobiales bacterium]|nr:MFS transporter [Acidimicrobiales bacterium]